MPGTFEDWIFGVEFEFAVAYLREPNTPPDPSDHQTVWFAPSEADHTRALKELYGYDDDTGSIRDSVLEEAEDHYHWLLQWPQSRIT